jgi:heterodisulfide reductase subunit B
MSASGCGPVSYYPGCSQESTAVEYDRSARAVCAALGIELRELHDWNCCGASSAHAVSHVLALALPARNLALAQAEGYGTLVAPCAACYNRLRRADAVLRERDSADAAAVEAAVGEGFRYTAPVQVKALVEVIGRDAGPAAVAARVRRELAGLRVVCYYGCLLTRPRQVTGYDDMENPVLLDQVMRACGAEALDWSYKTECCGGGLSVVRSDAVRRLVGEILDMAVEAGADAVVTACPMCLANLEMRRTAAAVGGAGVGGGGAGLPVFYFTELMALAFGLPGVGGWLRRHLVDPVPALRRRGISV